MKKMLLILLAATAAVSFTGCGTLFRGERVGKRASDRIDPTIMILDCCGLLFGLIPGVVALVLDFNNKTIYYTKSEASSLSDAGSLDRARMVAVKVRAMTPEAIAEALSRELGRPVAAAEIQFSATR